MMDFAVHQNHVHAFSALKYHSLQYTIFDTRVIIFYYVFLAYFMRSYSWQPIGDGLF